jgi:cytoskeletal protein RodZ
MSTSEEHFSNEKKDVDAMSPGQYLQQIRKEKDLSIEVVSEATKISIKNIHAIEEENYEALPADTFVRGLVNLYCNFLGLDGLQIAADFLAERENNTPAAGRRVRVKKHLHSSSLAPKKLAEPAHISSATIALILLAIIILSFTGFCLYTSWNPLSFLSQQTENLQTSMNEVFGHNEQEETEAENTTISTQTALRNPAVAQQLSYALSAFFLQDCTVEIRTDNQSPIRKTFKNGEMAEWHATHSLQVIFDKPEAAILKLNDTPLSFPEPEANQRPTLLLPDDLLDQ